MSNRANVHDIKSMVELFTTYPDVAQPLGGLHQAIMRSASMFSEGERELMASLVSALNACDFCVGVHEAAAEGFGVEPGLLKSLLDDIDSAAVSDKLKPVLKYVAKLTRDPARIVIADTDAIRAAGWDDDAIHNAVCVVAFYSFMNRYVDGIGLEAKADELRWMGEQLVR